MNKTKPFNKQTVLILILSILNLAICALLTLTIVPGQIPLHYNFHEQIDSLGSKWWLTANITLPLILAVLTIIFHKKEYLTFFLKSIFVFMLYNNLLTYSYLILATDLSIGALCEIPVAISIFMPLAVFIAVMAIKLKNIPYNTKFMGIRTKYTKANEFIWKQTHFFARDVFFAIGVALFFVLIPFTFIRLSYIPLALFLAAITTGIIIVNNQSKKMYQKYVDMKARQDKVNAANPEKIKEDGDSNTTEKTEEKPSENK